MRLVVLLVLCLPLLAPSQGPVELPVLSFASLAALITDVKAAIPRSGAEGFLEPSDADRVTFQRVVRLLLEGKELEALPLVGPLNYQLWRFTDPQTKVPYLVLRENPKAVPLRNQGTFVVSQSWWRNIVFEAPHPLYDLNTEDEGGALLMALRARALWISGTHRCSNAQSTLCTQATDAACDYYRVSDGGHNTRSYFHGAHLAALEVGNMPLTVSLHGNASSSVPEVAISDGTTRVAAGDALVNRMRSALRARNVGTVSCNLAGDNGALCGTTNVQGRASNNSAEPCGIAALAGGGRFLHIEQKIGIRQAPQALIEAFRELVPVPVTPVNAASFAVGAFAPGSLVSAFGGDLKDAQVVIASAAGQTWKGATSFSNESQVNFYLPVEVPLGEHTLQLTSPNGAVASVKIQVAPLGPGLFAPYQSLRAADGTQYLILYATGVRNRAKLSDVVVTVGGVAAEVQYAGAQPEFPGLDQINVRLAVAITGPSEVKLRVGEVVGNTITVSP